MSTPCPVTNLLEHSLSHEGETFIELAVRRAANIDMLDRLVERLQHRAIADYDKDLIMKARSHLNSAGAALAAISTRTREVNCCNAS